MLVLTFGSVAGGGEGEATLNAVVESFPFELKIVVGGLVPRAGFSETVLMAPLSTGLSLSARLVLQASKLTLRPSQATPPLWADPVLLIRKPPLA